MSAPQLHQLANLAASETNAPAWLRILEQMLVTFGPIFGAALLEWLKQQLLDPQAEHRPEQKTHAP